MQPWEKRAEASGVKVVQGVWSEGRKAGCRGAKCPAVLEAKAVDPQQCRDSSCPHRPPEGAVGLLPPAPRRTRRPTCNHRIFQLGKTRKPRAVGTFQRPQSLTEVQGLGRLQGRARGRRLGTKSRPVPAATVTRHRNMQRADPHLLLGGSGDPTASSFRLESHPPSLPPEGGDQGPVCPHSRASAAASQAPCITKPALEPRT